MNTCWIGTTRPWRTVCIGTREPLLPCNGVIGYHAVGPVLRYMECPRDCPPIPINRVVRHRLGCSNLPTNGSRSCTCMVGHSQSSTVFSHSKLLLRHGVFHNARYHPLLVPLSQSVVPSALFVLQLCAANLNLNTALSPHFISSST